MIRTVAAEKFSFTRFQMPCGQPASFSDLTEEQLTMGEMLGVSAENLRVFQAIGDSMADEGYIAGDLLFADSALVAKEGDVVLAEIDGEMAVKKIESQKPKLRLVSCNSEINYDPIEPQYGFYVVGVIIGSFRFGKRNSSK